MMKTALFSIMTLTMLLHLNPAVASLSKTAPVSDTHPISNLIGDWNHFRAGILAKTKQYDKYADIKDSQLLALPKSLVGTWRMQSAPSKPGYQLHTRLDLKANNKFSYQYVVMTGATRQEWDFSGRWEEKNQILMLLIDQSTYPGENRHDVLFWRLLQLGKSKLVYVRTGSDELFAMNRAA